MSLEFEITCPGCGKIIEYAGEDLSNVDRTIKRAMSDVKQAFKDSAQ